MYNGIIQMMPMWASEREGEKERTITCCCCSLLHSALIGRSVSFFFSSLFLSPHIADLKWNIHGDILYLYKGGCLCMCILYMRNCFVLRAHWIANRLILYHKLAKHIRRWCMCKDAPFFPYIFAHVWHALSTWCCDKFYGPHAGYQRTSSRILALLTASH